MKDAGCTFRDRTGSGEPAIGADDLRVDPAACRACQKRYHLGDVLRRTEAFKRCSLFDLPDLLLTFVIEKELGCHRAGRNGIDGDVLAAQFISQYSDQTFNASFCGDIGAVRGQRFGDHAAG